MQRPAAYRFSGCTGATRGSPGGTGGSHPGLGVRHETMRSASRTAGRIDIAHRASIVPRWSPGKVGHKRPFRSMVTDWTVV